jgi:CRP/FNR family transcriptional regulator, cyclic AMP receptor protein
MKERFQGNAGRQRLVEALVSQKLTAANWELATELAELVELLEVETGTQIIEQGADDTDVHLILTGSFKVLVNGKEVAVRGPNDSLGEMAAIQDAQPRSASVIANEKSVIAKLSEPQFAEVAARHPQIYRALARDLARRLDQRNRWVTTRHDKIRVFVISSVEALPIARAVQTAFEHDPFLTTIWTDGVFRASNYTLQSLEDEVDQSDFAIAIAHPDDQTEIRGKDWPTPRDNVIFELGFFMGRLGRKRAILMEPRDEKIKLPSDLAGVTTIPYRFVPNADEASLVGPACNKLRQHILALGPND